MPQSENWPFKRLMVDHLFHGATRVWWTLDPSFNYPSPHVFQLQASYTGQNNALDWTDIGDPAANAYFLTDDTTREHAGKRLLTHYRVVLTAGGQKFVSNPQGIWGVLNAKDWNLAREIVRKERLRHSLVSSSGYLLRKFRYGVKSTSNTDTLTGEIIDSNDPSAWGTAFKVGYHPPVVIEADFEGETINEMRGGDNVAAHSSRPTEFKMRIIAFPDVAKEDVWVDQDTDQRWTIHEIKPTVSWRGVPLVYDVTVRLVPHNNIIYKIPVTDLSYDISADDIQPATGDGCVRVDHDYGEDNAFVYQIEENCCPIEGATILVFTKADYDGGARTIEHAVATSQTTTNGEWAWAVKLNPGDYVLVFEKPGEYGPDVAALTVETPDPGPPPAPDLSSSVSQSQSSNFSDSFGGF